MGCPRIRGVHEEILRSVGCPCGLKAPPRHYPSPVLFAYRKGFRTPTEPNEKKRREVREETVPEVSSADEVSQQLHRFIELKKHLRGIEKSLRECEAQMSKAFDRLGVDRLQTDLGLLVRKWEGKLADWWIDV